MKEHKVNLKRNRNGKTEAKNLHTGQTVLEAKLVNYNKRNPNGKPQCPSGICVYDLCLQTLTLTALCWSHGQHRKESIVQGFVGVKLRKGTIADYSETKTIKIVQVIHCLNPFSTDYIFTLR